MVSLEFAQGLDNESAWLHYGSIMEPHGGYSGGNRNSQKHPG